MHPPKPDPNPGAAPVPPPSSNPSAKSTAGAARRRAQPAPPAAPGPGQKPHPRQPALQAPATRPVVALREARLAGDFGPFDKRRLELVFCVSIGQLDRRFFAVLEALFLHANVLRGIPAPVAVPSQASLSAKDIDDVIIALKKAYPAQFAGMFHESDPRAMMNVINKIRTLLKCAEVICQVILSGANGRGYLLNPLIESVFPAPLDPPSFGGLPAALPVQPGPGPAPSARPTVPGACREVRGKDAGACLV